MTDYKSEVLEHSSTSARPINETFGLKGMTGHSHE